MSENRIRKINTGDIIPKAGPHSAGIFAWSTTDAISYNADDTVRDFVTVAASTGASVLGATAAELNRATDVSARVITVTASTTLTAAAAESRFIVISSTTGLTVTLPSGVSATGDQYNILIGTVQTAGPYLIKVGSATEVLAGTLVFGTSAAAGASSFVTTAGSDTISLNGGTTGAASLGDIITLRSFKANTWSVSGQVTNTGTAATPFDATVS